MNYRVRFVDTLSGEELCVVNAIDGKLSGPDSASGYIEWMEDVVVYNESIGELVSIGDWDEFFAALPRKSSAYEEIEVLEVK